MQIEIINTGTELLLGRTLNTHHQWLALQLGDLGLRIQRQTSISDTASEIISAVSESLGRADLVITTGGLGPTSDDNTRSALAELLGLRLVQDSAVMDRINGFFALRNKSVPPHASIQAMVPEGGTVIPNDHGTAPGLAIEVPAGKFRLTRSHLVMLPGPPRELRPMFINQFMPWLRSQFLELPKLDVRTLRTTGLGESWVEETIAPQLSGLVTEGLEIGYCAKIGEVEIRLAMVGERGAEIAGQAEKIVRRLLKNHIFGSHTDTLERAVVELLKSRNKTLAVAESCTGGFLGHRLTNVPGASQVFMNGYLTYSNGAKERDLGVPSKILEEHGAVSEATARAMAEGCRDISKVDYSLSVTGIAGPTGGTDQKPVGTVFIGLAGPDGCVVEKNFNPYDRETFKFVTSQQALNLLRKTLLEVRMISG